MMRSFSTARGGDIMTRPQSGAAWMRWGPSTAAASRRRRATCSAVSEVSSLLNTHPNSTVFDLHAVRCRCCSGLGLESFSPIDLVHHCHQASLSLAWKTIVAERTCGSPEIALALAPTAP